MEEQVIQLLAATQIAAEVPQAEARLRELFSVSQFALTLASIASNEQIPVTIRQSALSVLRNVVLIGWSTEIEDFEGTVLVSDQDKVQLRNSLLQLSVDCPERKVKKAASYVVSQIGSVDFPEEWPDLLPNVLHTISTGTGDQIKDALKLLVELIDASLNEEQFFSVATQMLELIYAVSANEAIEPITRALAIRAMISCLDTLEMLLDTFKAEVKVFSDQVLPNWTALFMRYLQSPLPQPPTEEAEQRRAPEAEHFRCQVALKLQVVKILMRIKSIFPSNLAPHSPALFTATWEELKTLAPAYVAFFVHENRQGRLEDDDHLPYTLDWLVLEELDFLLACLKAPPVRKQLVQENGSTETTPSWAIEIFALLASFSQIATEEEDLWNIDINIYLAEETSDPTNFTARRACGDIVVKITEWIGIRALDGLIAHCQTFFGSSTTWKANEASLYLINLVVGELIEQIVAVDLEKCALLSSLIQFAMQQPDEFLQARAFVLAGHLARCAGHVVNQEFFERALQTLTASESDIVKVACVRALHFYLYNRTVPGLEHTQNLVFSTLSTYLEQQDLQYRGESDDFFSNILQTARDVILMDPKICIHGDGLLPLFAVAQHGAGWFPVSALITETVESVLTQLDSPEYAELYSGLCAKLVPALVSAFQLSSLTETGEDKPLARLATELFAILTEKGPDPLPHGLVSTLMPALKQILMTESDDEILNEATRTLQNLILHGAQQVFEYRESGDHGLGGLEVTLGVIDRLLSNDMGDSAATEVGRLAIALVEKAGQEQLGPYLMQLLRAFAIRLASAEKPSFIQSLILVFARITANYASDIVNFLAEVAVGNESGLQVVLTKWLQNAVNFYDQEQIRSNVVALTKLYELHDPRINQLQVKGDLIIQPSDGRILTRSRAKLQPEKYTTVTADLKITKILLEELHNASGGRMQDLLVGKTSQEEDVDSEDDDDEWEDEPDFFDLGLGASKRELMAYGEESNRGLRRPDESTSTFLVDFFRKAWQTPGFSELCTGLTAEEKASLQGALVSTF